MKPQASPSSMAIRPFPAARDRRRRDNARSCSMSTVGTATPDLRADIFEHAVILVARNESVCLLGVGLGAACTSAPRRAGAWATRSSTLMVVTRDRSHSMRVRRRGGAMGIKEVAVRLGPWAWVAPAGRRELG
jgi:hypothetical protein